MSGVALLVQLVFTTCDHTAEAEVLPGMASIIGQPHFPSLSIPWSNPASAAPGRSPQPCLCSRTAVCGGGLRLRDLHAITPSYELTQSYVYGIRGT